MAGISGKKGNLVRTSFYGHLRRVLQTRKEFSTYENYHWFAIRSRPVATITRISSRGSRGRFNGVDRFTDGLRDLCWRRPRLKRAGGDPPSSDDGEADIRQALEAGVHGYLHRGCPLHESIEAVTALVRGLRYLGRSVAQRVADRMLRASLTSREIDVLQLVVAGESNKAIARQLRIQVGTVKTHMHGVLAKLSATSRTQAAAIAVNQGIVEERTRRSPPGL